MADKSTLMQLSQDIDHLTFLKEIDPDLTEEDQKYHNEQLQALISRQKNKIDAYIALKKKARMFEDTVNTELKDIKRVRDSWKKKNDNLKNIIKFCVQQGLLNNKFEGERYQGTVSEIEEVLKDNFENWSEEDIKQYGLKKTTIISRLSDDSILEQKEEFLPDKDALKKALKENESKVPPAARLIKNYRVTVARRTRLSDS